MRLKLIIYTGIVLAMVLGIIHDVVSTSIDSNTRKVEVELHESKN